MNSFSKMPPNTAPYAVIVPDLRADGPCGPTFTVDPEMLRRLRAEGKHPLIIPAHDAKGDIDVGVHAFIRWSFDELHASDAVKAAMDDAASLRAVRDYAAHLAQMNRDISLAAGTVERPGYADLGELFDPRILVAPDFRNGAICLSQRFVDSLRLGARAILVIASGAERLEEEFALADASGIMLPGSDSDYHPDHSGLHGIEPKTPHDPLRDKLVKVAVEKAHAEDIPLFGICSGKQGIVLFGDSQGRLIQDLPGANRKGHHAARRRGRPPKVEPNSLFAVTAMSALKKKPERFGAAHMVRLAPGSFLTHLLNLMLQFRSGNQDNITNGFEVPVNSLHHQAVDEDSIGDDLAVEAIADDGTVEAVHSRRHKYIVGVQFHPEAVFMHNVPKQKPLEAALYRGLFWSFGQAARDMAWKKQITRKSSGGKWRNRGMAWIYMSVPGTIHMTPEFVTGGGFSGTMDNLLPKLWS